MKKFIIAMVVIGGTMLLQSCCCYHYGHYAHHDSYYGPGYGYSHAPVGHHGGGPVRHQRGW